MLKSAVMTSSSIYGFCIFNARLQKLLEELATLSCVCVCVSLSSLSPCVSVCASLSLPLYHVCVYLSLSLSLSPSLSLSSGEIIIGRVRDGFENNIWMREKLVKGDAFGMEYERKDHVTASTRVEVLYIPIKYLKEQDIVHHPELCKKALQVTPTLRSSRDFQLILKLLQNFSFCKQLNTTAQQMLCKVVKFRKFDPYHNICKQGGTCSAVI